MAFVASRFNPFVFEKPQDLTRPMIASFFFFSEYGGYIGAPFAVLAVIGAISDWRKACPWVLGGIIFLELYRGDTGPDALVVWLRELPLTAGISDCVDAG